MMRIVRLHTENFKRLAVVEIEPEGNLVKIGGKNGHGKSSVLDSIWVALKGRAVAPPRPVRDGMEKCTISVDMGDLIVTRTFHAKENGTFTDSVKVESADGLRYSKPQEVLDALIGEVGFDPFAFATLKPKEQARRLLEMVPLTVDLDELAERDASDYAKRRDVNRDVARLEAQLAGVPAEDVPAEAPDRAALTDALAEAANVNAQIESERRDREDTARVAAGRRNHAAELRAKAADLRAEADRLDKCAEQDEADAVRLEEQLAGLPPLDEPVDADAIRTQLRDAETVLAAIDRQRRRAELAGELEAARAESQRLTDAMAVRARERNAALAAAEMPVEGLALVLDDKGEPVLTFEGLPFDTDQISTAAILRVSTAIGMAANPRLRVLRISDGSLLDEDSMRMLAELADAEEFQLWVEVVGEGEGVGVVMENGEVRGAGSQADSPAAEKPKAKAKAAKLAGDEKLL